MTEERADCIKTMFAQACAVVFIAALVSFAIYVSI